MKKLKKLAAVITAALLAVSCFAVGSSAEENSPETAFETKEISIINYNVAGLPDLNWLLGKESKDVNGNQLQLGAILNSRDYDIIAVQEDFGYHSSLAQGLTNYSYSTIHSGGIPGGDGMNLFSKHKIYNEVRVKWYDAFGVIAEGADEMTPKGILYSVIELEDGVYLDFYNIHADAFDGTGSRAARESNFRQLAEMIISTSFSKNRPVIVVGDFNTYSSSNSEFNSNINYYMHELCGFKDAWTEIHNGGNYEDYSNWYSQGGNWGSWDSVEKILYKSGGGVELNATDFAYEYIYNNAGESISDHVAAIAKIIYTKTEDFVENEHKLTVTKEVPFRNFWNAVKVIGEDLIKIFSNFDELIAYLSE